MTMLRADMHVHTCYSKHNDNVAFLGARDCYSPPEAVYATAKARGMDLVAITDHDTIDGALALLDRMPHAPDIIVGEEVSCCCPDGGPQVHFGVYGMTETLHRELQPLRSNAFEVAGRLRAAGALFALNHLLHFYDPRLPLDDYLRLLDLVPAIEVRNGTMVPKHNRLAEQIRARWPWPGGSGRLAAVAGSDAHTLRRVGTTWTEAPGRNREEFLDSVRAGMGRPEGRDGGAWVVSGDAYGVIRGYIASLIGLEPQDHHGWRRVGCLSFALATLPFQFVPLLVATAGKVRERRTVREVANHLTAGLHSVGVGDVRV
jgi:predicted metal-dependent phosphoesterase TrpH